jgi:hypothetical protein
LMMRRWKRLVSDSRNGASPGTPAFHRHLTKRRSPHARTLQSFPEYTVGVYVICPADVACTCSFTDTDLPAPSEPVVIVT